VFMHPSWLVRMLLVPTIVTSVRSVCLEAVFRLSCQVPGLGVWGRSLLVIHMNSYCIATYQMMQVTSSDHVRAALTYACMAAVEVCRNGNYMAGMTEIEFYVNSVRTGWRLCQHCMPCLHRSSQVHSFDTIVLGSAPIADSRPFPDAVAAECAGEVPSEPGADEERAGVGEVPGVPGADEETASVGESPSQPRADEEMGSGMRRRLVCCMKRCGRPTRWSPHSWCRSPCSSSW